MRWATIATLVVMASSGCHGGEPASGTDARALSVAGVVEEVHPAAPYAYVRLRTSEGTRWVAIPLDTVQPGGVLRITNGVRVASFEIPGTGRKLDSVVFGVPQR